MNPVQRRILVRAVRLAVLGLIIWATYRALVPQLATVRGADLAAVRPNWTLLILSTFGILAFYLVHGLLWRLITGALSGAGRPPLRASMRVYFVSSLGRYLPGKLWQIAGMAALSADAGIPASAAIAANVLAQVAFMSTGALLLSILLPSYGIAALLAGIGLLAGVAGAFLLLGTSRGARIRDRLGERLGPRVRGALDMVDRVTPAKAARWWVFYLASWILLGGSFALFVIAFEAGAVSQMPYVAGTVAASYLLGYITPLPAGIGAREGVMAALLASVLPPAAAVVVSACSRLWFTAGELLPLMIIPLLPRPRTAAEIAP